MNIFRSENAPFAVVLLAGALGWYVSTLQSSLGDRLALLYSFSNESADQVSLRVENISRLEQFHDSFRVVCTVAEGDPPCLQRDKPPQYEVVAPVNLTNEVEISLKPDGSTAIVEAWVPPGATVKIVFPTAFKKSQFMFQYFPDLSEEGKPMPRFFRGGVESFVVKNFDRVLIWIFAASVICAALFLGTQIIDVISKPFKKEPDDDKPEELQVFVRHHFVDVIESESDTGGGGGG
jgi:hypothetical protein